MSGIGWYEFIKPGGSTTHIAHVGEGGSIYLPEGPEVITEQDFRLASATDRFWKLHRLTMDDATVERAARGLARHKWPTAMGLWESFGQGMRDDFKDAARAVLSAAVQEERAMNTDQNLSKEDNSMSNEHSDNCNNPETMCEDCLSTASEDHEAAE